jgi:hypothetical protein
VAWEVPVEYEKETVAGTFEQVNTSDAVEPEEVMVIVHVEIDPEFTTREGNTVAAALPIV